MKDAKIVELLHPRVIIRCKKLFEDGHYPEACHRAFELVAQAIKEKTGKHLFGRRLRSIFELGSKGVKLRTPFGPQMQEQASAYFDAAFQYYRNYSAHEGDKVDRKSCLRGLIVASELLEFIDASDVSFTEIGGLEGLVIHGVFQSAAEVLDLIELIQGKTIVDDTFDGLFEELAFNGYSQNQLNALFDVGLVEYEESTLPSDPKLNPEGAEMVGEFKLTVLGQKVLDGEAH